MTSAFVGVVTIVLLFSDESVDIQYHDTYFVIAQWHYTLTFSVLFLLFWVMYKALHRILYSLILTRAHVFLTLICFILYFFGDVQKLLRFQTQISYTFFSPEAFKYFKCLNSNSTRVLIFLISAQLIFVLNLLFGIFKFWFQREIMLLSLLFPYIKQSSVIVDLPQMVVEMGGQMDQKNS